MASSPPTISVIIAHTRATVRQTLDSLARQTIPHDAFEAIVVGDKPDEATNNGYDFPLRYVRCADRNPSLRRNLGAEQAAGEILAFIDDDAQAADDWLAAAQQIFQTHPEVGVVGGPTYLPEGAPLSHVLTYKIAHAGFFGNGHENLRQDTCDLRQVLGYVTCCNMLIFPARLEEHRPFNIHVGYGGEDTTYLYEVSRHPACRIMYSLSVAVRHSRGAYGLSFLKSRLGYRINNGMMLWAKPEVYLMNRKFRAGLAVAALLSAAFLVWPKLTYLTAVAHLAISFGYAVRYRHEDWRLCFLFPPALLIQHIVYALGIALGLLSILTPSGARKIWRIRRRLR